eukprot:g82709.t1
MPARTPQRRRLPARSPQRRSLPASRPNRGCQQAAAPTEGCQQEAADHTADQEAPRSPLQSFFVLVIVQRDCRYFGSATVLAQRDCRCCVYISGIVKPGAACRASGRFAQPVRRASVCVIVHLTCFQSRSQPGVKRGCVENSEVVGRTASSPGRTETATADRI